ncbi:hypothetical protein BJ875DRAFT_160408 [Amylocarpus encephaloides]|uniref:Zn(2)-C6 fungal-type domain-containing protein n=1 Tax=Amylocarpus encephaloides TaxID=45428 RepID=A0A9P7YPC1_9HELO|nr:hypothetical protein BJ875DRAFT_160408 [Amylocarpus encephaloides]
MNRSGSTIFESTFDTVAGRDQAESISMFFDFESSPPSMNGFSLSPAAEAPSPPAEPESSSKATSKSSSETTAATPRGGIRVSLACIPCRSRHVKCGAEMPSCSRCTTDDKPCFYAKSRRGMRDRNAPKKNKVSPSNSRKVSPNPEFETRDAFSMNGYAPSNDPWGLLGGSGSGSAVGNFGSQSPGSERGDRPASTRKLIDLFYTFFYKAHPFVLPRYYLLSHFSASPSSLTHLVTVISYIGTLYDASIPTSPYRSAAVNILVLPTLPPTGFTVQTLLLLSLALLLEDRVQEARGVLDRAIYMAVELGMNDLTFADSEPDGVLAESWRRTYFGLIETDGMMANIGASREGVFV